jgi:hypothetical protein
LQAFIDELSVSGSDLKKMKQGLESDLARFLLDIEKCCSLVWLVPSTTSLLERTSIGTSSTSVSLSAVRAHLAQRCPSFPVRELGLCMRSSGNIAGAAGAEEVQRYCSGATVTTVSVLTPGRRSTVAGPRPVCLLSPWTSYPDYTLIGRCLSHWLPQLLAAQLRSHVVILCGGYISARRVAGLLPSHLASTHYEGGVDLYDDVGSPSLLSASARVEQRPGVRAWLTGPGGVLVTHASLYRGMEAPTVILITRDMDEDGLRSHLMRAVAQLVVICDSGEVKEEEVRKMFDITRVQ